MSASEVAITADEQQDIHTLTCDCGKVTSFRCDEIWSATTLVPCRGPLCANGCKSHRHQAGTMGYSAQMKGSTRYAGDEPDDDGFWEWLKSRYREIFWSAPRKAQQVYKEICTSFAPPAPWPYLQLQVGRRCFESRGPEGMFEVEEYSDAVKRNGGL